jgi:hypothetical protein
MGSASVFCYPAGHGSGAFRRCRDLACSPRLGRGRGRPDEAVNADLVARVAFLDLQNEKMRRALFGRSAERGRLLVNQLELGFEELETTAGEDEALAAKVAAGTGIEAFTRARPPRRPLPAHLPRLRDGEPAARTISRHVARPVRSALARAGAV